MGIEGNVLARGLFLARLLRNQGHQAAFAARRAIFGVEVDTAGRVQEHEPSAPCLSRKASVPAFFQKVQLKLYHRRSPESAFSLRPNETGYHDNSHATV